jgi:hypothetical protein
MIQRSSLGVTCVRLLLSATGQKLFYMMGYHPNLFLGKILMNRQCDGLLVHQICFGIRGISKNSGVQVWKISSKYTAFA